MLSEAKKGHWPERACWEATGRGRGKFPGLYGSARACGRPRPHKAGPHGGKGRRRMAEGLVNAPIQRMQLRRRAKAKASDEILVIVW